MNENDTVIAAEGEGDDREIVFLIQRILLKLSLEDDDFPRVVPDGIFGPETAEAVRVFQRYEELPVTGVVNEETFARLLEADTRLDELGALSAPIRPFERFLADGKLSPGDVGDLVRIVQTILDTLAIAYRFPEIAVDGIYGPVTEEAVKLFQKANFLEQTGEIDKLTWNRLARAYDKYVDSE